MLQGNDLDKARDEIAFARSITALLIAVRLKVSEDRKQHAKRVLLGEEEPLYSFEDAVRRSA